MADIINSLNPITRVAAALRELSRAPPPLLPPPLQPPPAAWPPARAAGGGAPKPAQPPLQLPPPSSELRRGLSAFANFALTLTAVGVLPSICTGWAPAMATGGPAVILAAWFVVGTFTTLTGVAMAELNAAYPSAGSVYYWAARLAPRRHAALAAYACGVLNLVGNAAGNAAFALGFANFVSKAVQLRGWVDGVGPPAAAEPLSQGGVVAVAIAVSVCWAALNALRIDQLGLVQNLAALWQVGATVVIVAVVLGAPQRDPDVPRDWVWSARYSGTGLEDGSQYSSYVALLGLLNALFAFCGIEAGTHMAEETHNAEEDSSWGIVHCCLVTFAVGLVLNLGLLYATPTVLLGSYAQWRDAGGLAAGGASENPLVAPGDTSLGAYLRLAMSGVAQGGGSTLVFFSATGARGGAALTALLIVSSFFTGVASFTATSRTLFAMARDGALPGSSTLVYVSPATATPLATVGATLALDVALLMVGLASSQGLSAVLSVTVIGFQLSYAMPMLLRCALPARAAFEAHPAFDLRRASLPLHALSGAWLVFSSVILLFPTAAPVTPDSANYTVAVLAGVGVAAAAWWVLSARRTYAGPREAVEAAEAAEAAGAAGAGAHRAGSSLERLTSAAYEPSGEAAGAPAEEEAEGSQGSWAASGSRG